MMRTCARHLGTSFCSPSCMQRSQTKEAIATSDPVRITDGIGDHLFADVNLARKSGLDAESALQAATDKFVSWFYRVQDEVGTRGKKLGEVGLEELDAIWNEIK